MLDAKLVVVGGDAKAAEIRLRLPTIIGRGRDANLTLPHPLVSRQHCEIFEHDGQLLVRDLKSLNGTYVDNKRIEAAEILEPNQLLTVGNVTFRAMYSHQTNGVLENTEPVLNDETRFGDPGGSVVECSEIAVPDADSKIDPVQSDSIHSRPTQPGRPSYKPERDSQRNVTSGFGTTQEEVEEPHSVVAAMAEISEPDDREISLSSIERQLPVDEHSTIDINALSIHDDDTRLSGRPTQSFHGIDGIDESDDDADKVEADDSRLGSFIRKLPR